MSMEKTLAEMTRDYYDRKPTVDAPTTPIPELLEQLDLDCPSARTAALEGLASHFSRGAVDEYALDRVIGHGMAQRGKMDTERRATLRAIGLARHDELLQEFVPLLSTRQTEALWVASLVLGYGRYEPAVPALTNALADAEGPAVDAMTWALGKIGTRDAVTVLRAMLAQSIHPRAVAAALAEGGHIEAVDTIAELLYSDSCEDALVGVLGLLALAEQRGSDPRLAIGLGRARDALESCARHPSPTIAGHAIECLTVMTRVPAHVRLVQTLTRPPGDGLLLAGVAAKLN